jgi:hypothetical protein
VAVEGRIRESVIVVHVTSIENFLWEDTADNVPPTCCCPENRNGKGVCCGIMAALQAQPQFQTWFGNNWFKRELLARRHRCDCDPFVDILQRLQRSLVQTPENPHTALVPATQSGSETHRIAQSTPIPTPESIAAKLQVM